MSSNAQLLYLKGVYSNAGYKHSAIVSSVVDRFEQIMPFSQFQIFQKSYFQKISNAKDFFSNQIWHVPKNFKGQTLLLPKVLFKKENWSQIINPANPGGEILRMGRDSNPSTLAWPSGLEPR